MDQNAHSDKIKVLTDHCDTQEQFNQLGNKFPEFLKFENIEDSGQFNDLPLHIRDNLTSINSNITKLQEKISANTTKLQLLADYKEESKRLNDQLSGAKNGDDVKPKSKSKAKRIELCLCNKQLRQVNQQIIDGFKNNVDRIIEAYNSDETSFQDICLVERRKCPRHNGWFSLFHDEFVRAMGQDEGKLSELTRLKKLLIRDHSISVYESKESKS